MLDHLKDTTRTGLWCMLLISAGALLFGFENGWWGTIQGAEAFLRDYGTCETVNGIQTCDITTGQRSAESSVQSGGIMIGSLLSVYVNKKWGRRLSLIISAFISVVGILLELTSAIGRARFSQFVVGKSITSVSMGMVANIVPIYLSETSTTAARGFTINMYQNVQIIGYVLASVVVYASAQRKDAAAYYIPLGLQLLAPVVMISLTPLLPESPRWLLWNNRTDDAIHAATRLFATHSNGFDAVDYIHQIEVAIEQDKNNPETTSWGKIFQGSDLRRLMIAIGIQSLMQAQGSSYITSYYVSFLKDMGVTDYFPWITGLVIVYYGGILTGHFLPDRYGRRPVLIGSTAVCAIFMIIVAAIMTAIPPGTSDPASHATMAMLFIWQLSCGIMSPLIWIVCTEAAPSRNREKVLSIAIFMGFGVALLVTSASPYIQDRGYGNLGIRIGFLWGAFSVITAIWSFFMVPETKGLSLEQLDFLYQEDVPARQFRTYKFPDSVLEGNQGKDLELKAEANVEVIEAAKK